MSEKQIHLVWKEMAIRHHLDEFDDKDGNELDIGELFDQICTTDERSMEVLFKSLGIRVAERYEDDSPASVANYIQNMAFICHVNADYVLAMDGKIAVPILALDALKDKVETMIHLSVSDDCAFGCVVTDLVGMEGVLEACTELHSQVPESARAYLPKKNKAAVADACYDALSDEIKAQYLASEFHRSDANAAVARLMTECSDLFENEQSAWGFLMEAPEEGQTMGSAP